MKFQVIPREEKENVKLSEARWNLNFMFFVVMSKGRKETRKEVPCSRDRLLGQSQPGVDLQELLGVDGC